MLVNESCGQRLIGGWFYVALVAWTCLGAAGGCSNKRCSGQAITCARQSEIPTARA